MTNTKRIRQTLTEIQVLREALKKLNSNKYRGGKYSPSQQHGLCHIINEILVVNWFYSRSEYIFKHEFGIYRGSDNKKIQTALKMSEYTGNQKEFQRNPNTTFMWNLDVYGWQYRVMFCEGLIEEKLQEIKSRLKNSSWLFKSYVKLLTPELR